MRKAAITAVFAAAMMAAGPAFAADNEKPQGQGQAVVTILPAHESEGGPANISAQDVNVRIDGKGAQVLNWRRGESQNLELVVLLDQGARSSLGTQMNEITQFVNGLPQGSRVTLAYMQNGRAVMSGPLTADHAQALKGLHLPMGEIGASSSPYFCLSDLAKNWPSQDRKARREVVMVTDGVDYYNPRYDPDDPYVQAAIHDSVRAGLVVYTIYWQNRGRFDSTQYANNAGQNLMQEVTQATGGNSYWQGFGNPVSFQPYFKDLDRRFQNQYELSFAAPVKNKQELGSMKLKVNGLSGKIDAPQQVVINPAM